MLPTNQQQHLHEDLCWENLMRKKLSIVILFFWIFEENQIWSLKKQVDNNGNTNTPTPTLGHILANDGEKLWKVNLVDIVIKKIYSETEDSLEW